MKSIYNELLDAVEKGRKFKVDLVNKSLWIDRKQIIEKGEIIHDEYKGKDLIGIWDLALNYANSPLDEDPWNWVEVLHCEYKHSAPSKHSNSKSYFKALPFDELTDADLAYGYDRDFAQAMLEGYILLSSLIGWLTWNNDNHWFCQSNSDKELIVLKEWVKKGN